MMKIRVVLALLTLLPVHAIAAQQDGLVAHPHAYRVQFENAWVRVVRASIPANANLAMHSHPPGFMVHVYLDDAEPLVFEHDGSPFTVTRPPVAARSYRIGRATPESHATISSSAKPSTYLRVELKTQGYENTRRRVSAAPLTGATQSVVESTGGQLRISRITIAPGETFEVTASATEAALLIAVTDGVSLADGQRSGEVLRLGQDCFVDLGQRQTLRNGGTSHVQLLRFDFLTKPAP
jgi:hypothetical protein